MGPPERDSGITLAQLLAAFSLATDLGLGQPMEHVLRSWCISCRLGERMGLAEQELRSLFFIAMMAWVGCVADTPEVTSWFGDDIEFRNALYRVDLAGLPALGFLVRRAGMGGNMLHRLRRASTLTVTGGKDVVNGLRSHCTAASAMAARLVLGPDVQDPLHQFFARWDGQGVPSGVGGEQIAMAVRLFQLADVIEVYHRADGMGAALDVARQRRGRQFDPAIVDALCGAADEVLVFAPDDRDCYDLIASDPALQDHLTEDELDGRLEALADFTDLRSTYRAGHSRGVARLAGDAARLAGLPSDDVATARRAGWLHDIGMHGVPGVILDKPGPLSATERERLRLSSYYTERVLAAPGPLARVGAIAALANERMDGSGYHRGLSGSAIPMTGRILAAAEIYQSQTEPRPERKAGAGTAAVAALRLEVRAGHIAAEAADAVIAAAGRPRQRRRLGPAGLTPREIEVLVLIARGASTGRVAQVLDISPKTAANHVERIYAKTGSSSRATATLFALNQGLIDTSDPLDS